MTQAFINSLVIIVVSAALTFLAAKYWFNKNQLMKTIDEKAAAVINKAKALAEEAEKKAIILAEENARLIERLRRIELQIGAIDAAVTPISAAFQAILIKELTHYHTPEMDALLVKVTNETINENEAERLTVMLKERTVDMGDEITSSEREAAEILPAVMRRVKTERIAIDAAKTIEVKLVSVAPEESSNGKMS